MPAPIAGNEVFSLGRQATRAAVTVSPLREPAGAFLEEGTDERAVLVQRRAADRAVLLERERQLGAALELGTEHAKGAQAEGAQRSMKGGSPHA